MAASRARENILKKVRQALSNPVPLPFIHEDQQAEVFVRESGDLAAIFANEFGKLQGRLILCNNKTELRQKLTDLITEHDWIHVYYQEDWVRDLFDGQEGFKDLEACDVSITGCDCLVARTGTIVMSSAKNGGRTTSVYAPIHVCIAYRNQLLYDPGDALSFLRENYKQNFPSFITFASGPSRTADIEKTLVTGVHGPKEVYCLLVNE